MALYLLDSEAVIDYLNRYAPTLELLEGIKSQNDALCTCDVVLSEVYAGLHPHDEATASELLPVLNFLETSPAAAEFAGRWRYTYRRQGRVLPLADALIAATAMSHQAIVVTGNVRDFSMPGVSVLRLPRLG